MEEHIGRLVDGDLASDGVQYSAEVTTVTVNTWYDVLETSIDAGVVGALDVLEFGLTAEFKGSDANADLEWQWQARNKDGTYVDLHGEVTETNPGTTYVSRTRSGYATIVDNLNALPLDVKLRFRCTSAGDTATAKAKNSSYVKGIFREP